jgi:hypothetical protein
MRATSIQKYSLVSLCFFAVADLQDSFLLVEHDISELPAIELFADYPVALLL